uniref:Uncharacterized protein n=1 Tax=Guillardia theta TaxID=55529 RepID=A0A7S4NPW1_GUITH
MTLWYLYVSQADRKLGREWGVPSLDCWKSDEHQARRLCDIKEYGFDHRHGHREAGFRFKAFPALRAQQLRRSQGGEQEWSDLKSIHFQGGAKGEIHSFATANCSRSFSLFLSLSHTNDTQSLARQLEVDAGHGQSPDVRH